MNQKTHKLQPVGLLLSCLLTVSILLSMLTMGTEGEASALTAGNITDLYQRNLTNQISNALENVIHIEKTYQLSDSDIVAPKPNPACYGQVDSPEQMQAILEQAAPLLAGQTTLFTPETPVKEGSPIQYYLDETIFAVTWKQSVEDCTYTFSEVKVAHASQFRRFLSEGKYNSGILHTASEMAQSVNAVVASSGDYYGYRSFGIVVHEGQVYRDRGHLLDTCYIDDQGDLLFTYAGEITDQEAAQKFVDDHNIRFSVCFGPVMVLNGEYCVPNDYNSGEVKTPYARAALCQMDRLHYVVVTANAEDPDYSTHTVAQFGRNLHAMGIPTAYALDGGQTATIVMDGQVINTVSYGAQRDISDIIYFATALPETSEVRQ